MLYFIAAYSLVWLMVFLFLLRLGRTQRRLESQAQALEASIAELTRPLAPDSLLSHQGVDRPHVSPHSLHRHAPELAAVRNDGEH